MMGLLADVRTDSDIKSSRRSWVEVDSIMDSGVVRTERRVGEVRGGLEWRERSGEYCGER